MELGFFDLYDGTAYPSRSTSKLAFRHSVQVLTSPALVSSDLRERVEVNFLFLFRSEIRPDFRHRLGPVDVPHHRMPACSPAIHPTNHAAPVGPDQISDRDALTFIIVHCLLTSCTEALSLQRDELRCSPAPHAALGECWLTALPGGAHFTWGRTKRSVRKLHCFQILWSGSVAASTIARTSDSSKPSARDNTMNSTTSIRRWPLSMRATRD